jgi:hypothetical protein
VVTPSGLGEALPEATWWPHPEGYAMVLPAGWSGVAIDESRAGQLIAAVLATDPELAARIGAVLDSTDARISAIAADGSAVDGVGPLVIVLAQPTQDRGAHAVKSLVKEQIAGLPGLADGPFRDDVSLPSANGVQFEFTIADPTLGVLQVRALLFRFGSDAYLVSFVAPEAEFEAAEAIFEAIAASLRFGV